MRIVVAVIGLCVVVTLTAVLCAQSPSRLETIADTLRASRGNAEVTQLPDRVPDDLPAKRATLHDPLQTPDDFVSKPPQNVNPIPAFAANRNATPAEPQALSMGNPRDPLGTTSVFGTPAKLLSPYIEAIHDATLRDVTFISPLVGWAVGDHGAVWQTQDGGTTWQLQITPVDATLYAVHFLDALCGMAVGGYTLPITGEGRGFVIATTDGGQNWFRVATSVPLPILKTVRLASPIQAEVTGLFSESLRTSRFQTNDRGTTWEPIAETTSDAPSRPESVTATIGDDIWLAGRYSARIAHSSDRGQTWESATTGVQANIERIAFIDRNNGWGVGTWGTIIHTTDGGKSWAAQQGGPQGGKRLAVIAVVATEDEIPFEVLTQLAAEEGYRCGVLVLFPRDDAASLRRSIVPWSLRLGEAVRKTGADLLPLPTPEEQTTFSGPQSALAVRRHIVRAIRQMQPEVIITSDVSTRRDDAMLATVRQGVEDAIRDAANPTVGSFAESTAAWSPRKLLLTMPRGVHGATMVAAHEPLQRLGLALADVAWDARSLLGIDVARIELPSMIGLQTAATSPDTTTHQSDPMAGVKILPDSGARRSFCGTEQLPREAVQRHQQLREELINQLEAYNKAVAATTVPPSPRQLAAAIESTVKRLDPDTVVKTLWKWSDQLHRRGQWYAASLQLFYLVETFPKHPLAGAAAARLAVYTTSEEVAMRLLQGDAVSAAAVTRQVQQRDTLERLVQTSLGDIFGTPEIQFPLTLGQRRSGWQNEAMRYYKTRAGDAASGASDVWSQRASAETWLADRTTSKGVCPLPTIVCAKTTERPYLDAAFDRDSDKGAWFAAPLHCIATDQTTSTHFMFLHDDEYLYVALRCREAAEFSYTPPPAEPRTRDSDLTRSDRVELTFDVDRDWVSAYTMTVDYRGWVHDSSWGDTSWDPDWYVARDAKDGSWLIEAAIPLKSLTRTLPTPGTVWAVGVRRIVGGGARTSSSASWYGSTTGPPEESLGLMVFE
ncbi:MAG: YCF48-related protein [Thermoguttaceae bacterium]